jgi:hypothetical protein
MFESLLAILCELAVQLEDMKLMETDSQQLTLKHETLYAVLSRVSDRHCDVVVEGSFFSIGIARGWGTELRAGQQGKQGMLKERAHRVYA